MEEVTGKVEGIVYDHFGDFVGFVLEGECAHEHRFESREKPMLELLRRVGGAATRPSRFGVEEEACAARGDFVDGRETRARQRHSSHQTGRRKTHGDVQPSGDE